MATDRQPAYQDVHGLVPSGPTVDAEGLAQQTTGGAMPGLDSLALTSNVGLGVDFDREFMFGASQQQEQRIAAGYAADGTVGGPFSRENPPPGMQFAGYKKGATGIQWKPIAAQGSVQAPESHGTAPAKDRLPPQPSHQEPGVLDVLSEPPRK